MIRYLVEFEAKDGDRDREGFKVEVEVKAIGRREREGR